MTWFSANFLPSSDAIRQAQIDSAKYIRTNTDTQPDNQMAEYKADIQAVKERAGNAIKSGLNTMPNRAPAIQSAPAIPSLLILGGLALLIFKVLL